MRELSKGAGMIKTISISNTMKIKPSRKKRKENGIRALFLGSKPHSKGEVFSRSSEERVLRTQAAPKVNKARRREINKARVRRFIYRKILFDLKSGAI